MINLKKESDEEIIRSIPDRIRQEEKTEYCKYCRHYEISWLAFICAMGFIVVPLIIIKTFSFSEEIANTFGFSALIIGILTFLINSPNAIKKADKEFKELHYRSHYHI